MSTDTAREVAPDPDPSAEWWTTTDVAKYLGVRTATVSSYHRRGQMPPADKKIGRTQLWKPRTILTWVDTRPGRGNWDRGH